MPEKTYIGPLVQEHFNLKRNLIKYKHSNRLTIVFPGSSSLSFENDASSDVMTVNAACVLAPGALWHYTTCESPYNFSAGGGRDTVVNYYRAQSSSLESGISLLHLVPTAKTDTEILCALNPGLAQIFRSIYFQSENLTAFGNTADQILSACDKYSLIPIISQGGSFACAIFLGLCMGYEHISYIGADFNRNYFYQDDRFQHPAKKALNDWAEMYNSTGHPEGGALAEAGKDAIMRGKHPTDNLAYTSRYKNIIVSDVEQWLLKRFPNRLQRLMA